MLTGLRNSFAPEGTLEEVLVEKLAALLWRNRRLLIAEGAEIRAGAEFLESDGQERQRQEVAKLPQLRGNGGLMRWLANPEALQGCLYLLNILRESIERIGFDPDWDKKNLTTLYGEHHKETLWRETLFNRYLIWLTISLSSEEEPQEKGTTSPQQCKDMFLAELVAEIKRLERYEQEQATVVSDKLKLESLCSNVPDAQQLDRLLRYETTLERGIDRVLNQIERLQRMRLGQPVAPSLNVNVSSS
ncbi:MAG TPA: hypothetical protein VOA64_20860 [Candidatus Dormibacteraeota bacterium]|nr:hypothetical protein [Candidatus Dormibacteraeota bacterium]